MRLRRKGISGIYRGKGEFGEYLRRLADKAVAVRALSFMADGTGHGQFLWLQNGAN